MNNISVVGRVCSDVTLKEFNGRNCANFRIAANTRRKDKNSQNNDYITNFYNVSLWGAAGENAAKYLKKGHRAGVTGELVIRPYKDSNGADRIAVEIDANNVDFIETKAESEAKSGATVQSAPVAQAPAQQFTSVETDDLLPF